MVDPVFADELLAARGIGLVHAHASLGQRHAETVLLAVLQLEIDADFLVRDGQPVGGPVVVGGAVVDEVLVHGDVRGRHQGKLLGLVVLDGRAPVE